MQGTINSSIEFYLDRCFGEYKLIPISSGKTDAQLFDIRTKTGRFILKCQKNSLRDYYLNLKWLQHKVPVPKIIFYESHNGYDMLCMTAVRGKPLSCFSNNTAHTKVIKKYAQALKLLHALRTDEDAVVQNLEERLRQARYNAKHELINREMLQPENQHTSAQDLFEKLIALKPANFDLVFTHGDFCPDNLFFDGETLSGFIDLDRGGVADRYQDIALAVRNIKDEFGDELVNLFFREYGLKRIDQRKIDFYVLLDEFF